MRRYLLDTHTIIWFLAEDKKLNKTIYDNIRYFQHDYFVSIASLHEIVTKQTIKKLDIKMSITKFVEKMQEYNIEILPIELRHLKTLETLSIPVISGEKHFDPFDRIIIAQSISEKLTLISADMKFPYYQDKNFTLLEF